MARRRTQALDAGLPEHGATDALLARIEELEGHRKQWRAIAYRYRDSLQDVCTAAGKLLSLPVRAPLMVPLPVRSDLQDAWNRAERVFNDVETPSEGVAK